MPGTQVGQAKWYSRVLAILYAWTIGLAVAIVILPLGMVYALLGHVLRVLGVGRQSDLPLSGPVRTTFEWWYSIHHHAISGTGVYKLRPSFNS